jgi:hypothetical protein
VIRQILQPNETVLRALKRLGQPLVKRGEKRKAAGQPVPKNESFDRLTEAADFLMRMGQVDVYQATLESYGSPVESPPVTWEYQATDGKLYGPYPTDSIIAWQKQVATTYTSHHTN